jgi:tRNA(Ile)-lysidine synthase
MEGMLAQSTITNSTAIMISTIESFFKKNSIGQEPMIVSVSGGKDSMALLHALSQLKSKLVVAHVNYHLRGDDSNQDEAVVQQFCQEHNIIFEKRDAEEAPQGNLQDWARKIRMDFFQELKIKHQALWIVLAHHADDLRESQWLKFLRLSLNGIMGMKPINQDTLRPLLYTPRAEIEKYIVDHQVPYRDDQSNFDSKYNRNWLRNNLIPEVEERFPTSIAANIEFQKKSENQLRWIEWFTAQWLAENIDQKDSANLELDSAKIPEALPTSWILYQWLHPYGFGHKETDKIAQLPYLQTGAKIENQHYTVGFHLGKWMLTEKELNVTESISIDELPFHWINHEAWEMTSSQQVNPGWYGMSDIHQLDLQKLQSPMVLRRWKTGDDFQPLGMKGKMKVADFLNKKGVPAIKKDQYWLLDTPHGIACIVGLQIAEWCKIKEDSKEVLVIRRQHQQESE